MISDKIIAIGTGASASVAAQWAGHLNLAMVEFGITTPNSIAAFLANIGVESGGLTVFVENLNYRPERLAAVWPDRYAQNPKDKGVKIPNAKAKALGGNPRAIANDCYANRMGNGRPETGDGWRYRGQGPIQVTGKFNMTEIGNRLGIDLLSNPELLQQPSAGSRSAAYFFKSRGCVAAADAGEFGAVVKKINGSLPSDANHGPLRTKRYVDCKEAILASGTR